MTLQIALTPEKSQLIIQEDTLVRLLLTNNGKEPISIPDPHRSTENPVFKVRRISTGELFTHRRKEKTNLRGEPMIPLPPGKSVEWPFWLLRYIPLENPGEYEIYAQYEWGDGKGIARSEPFTMKIDSYVPQTLALGMTQEAIAEEIYIFWLRLNDGKTQLMRSLISNFAKPEISETLSVGDFPDRTPFLVSVPFNRGNPLDTWLGWMRDRNLNIRFVPNKIARTDNKSVLMPDAIVRIANHPLLLENGGAEVLMWMGTKDGETAMLQIALIAPDGQSQPGGHIRMATAIEPLWVHTAFLLSKERRAYTVDRETQLVRLRCATWDNTLEFKPFKDLMSVPGRFVAAGLTVQRNDRVTGMLITRADPDDGQVTLHEWTHQPDGTFALGAKEIVDLNGADRIDQSIIRFNGGGEPYIALRPSGQPWHVRAPEGSFSPVGGEVGNSQMPIGMFFNRAYQPIFVYMRREGGFYFADATGEPAQTTQRG